MEHFYYLRSQKLIETYEYEEIIFLFDSLDICN